MPTETIEQRRTAWEKCVNAGDVAGYVSFIDEDAVWVSQNLVPVVGKQVIKDWLTPFFKQFDYAFTTSNHQIQSDKGWACEQASFSSKITPKNGTEPMTHNGRYIILWQENEHGIWMINRYTVVAEI